MEGPVPDPQVSSIGLDSEYNDDDIPNPIPNAQTLSLP